MGLAGAVRLLGWVRLAGEGMASMGRRNSSCRAAATRVLWPPALPSCSRPGPRGAAPAPALRRSLRCLIRTGAAASPAAAAHVGTMLGDVSGGRGRDVLAHRRACTNESVGAVLVAVSTETSVDMQPFGPALTRVGAVTGSSRVLPVFWLPPSVYSHP